MQYTQFSDISSKKSNLSFWQSPLWKNILLDSRQAKEVFYFWNINSTFLLVEIRSIGSGFFGAFSLGVSASQIDDDFEVFSLAFKDFLKEKKVLFWQIEPIDDIKYLPAGSRPFKKFLTPHTRCIDLEKDEEDILAGMHTKGRYNVRLAERRGVEIRPLEVTAENIDTFFNLLQETTERDGFNRNEKVYYENFLKILGENGRFFGAFFEGKMVAGGIFVLYSERAVYYYGASTSEKNARKQRAPHFLQWTAIQEAKNSGAKVYDFLGIADPKNPKDPLMGVSGFKEQFGGYVVELPKKSLYPISHFRFFMYRLAKGVKRILKGK